MLKNQSAPYYAVPQQRTIRRPFRSHKKSFFKERFEQRFCKERFQEQFKGRFALPFIVGRQVAPESKLAAPRAIDSTNIMSRHRDVTFCLYTVEVSANVSAALPSIDALPHSATTKNGTSIAYLRPNSWTETTTPERSIYLLDNNCIPTYGQKFNVRPCMTPHVMTAFKRAPTGQLRPNPWAHIDATVEGVKCRDVIQRASTGKLRPNSWTTSVMRVHQEYPLDISWAESEVTVHAVTCHDVVRHTGHDVVRHTSCVMTVMTLPSVLRGPLHQKPIKSQNCGREKKYTFSP